MSQDATRMRIEALREEIRERQEEVVRLRGRLAPQTVEDYELGRSGGTVRLSELFGPRLDLLVVHNMGRECPWCTLWADGLNGILPHLEARAAFAVVSPDPPAVQTAFARSRGWRFTMASAEGSDFTKDLGYEETVNGRRFLRPGVSAFRRQPGGSLLRVAQDEFGPGDPYCAAFHLFDLLPEGCASWSPELAYPGR